jgi:phage head maturation protease
VIGPPKFWIRGGDTFKGYASIFNTAHLDGSVVVPGCFNYIRHPVPLLLEHDSERVVGRVELIHEDHRGLYVEGTFIESLGRIQGSIGLESGQDMDQPLSEAELVELSLTEKPVCPGAGILGIRQQRTVFPDKKTSDKWERNKR